MTLPDRILLILESGRWVRMNEIAATLRVPRREVEQALEDLRLAGHPIIAGLRGVALTSDPERLEKYVTARRSRAASEFRGTRALRRTLRSMRSREDLTFWGAA